VFPPGSRMLYSLPHGGEKGALPMTKAGLRLLQIATLAAATSVLMFGSATAATADPVSDKTPVVPVSVTTAGGITMPDEVRSGVVTFTFTQADGDEHAVQGFRLKPGGSLDAVLGGFTDALLGDFPTRVKGLAAIDRGATLIGGSLILPTKAMSVTVPLDKGTYYFFDYSDLGVRTPRLHTIKAVGSFRWSPLPRFTAIVVATMQNDEPRFVTPTSLSTTQSFLFRNDSDEDHEVMFRPTQAGVTDDYITAFYDAVLAGGPRPPSPWTGVQHGLQPVSPGLWAVVQIDLPAGPYAEICYVPDDMSGIPHAYEGMHVMVTLS
jgi:hypothetical protein